MVNFFLDSSFLPLSIDISTLIIRINVYWPCVCAYFAPSLISNEKKKRMNEVKSEYNNYTRHGAEKQKNRSDKCLLFNCDDGDSRNVPMALAFVVICDVLANVGEWFMVNLSGQAIDECLLDSQRHSLILLII